MCTYSGCHEPPAKDKRRCQSHLDFERTERAKKMAAGLCTTKGCNESASARLRFCSVHLHLSEVAARKYRHHYTPEDEHRFKTITVCDWCRLPLKGEIPHQDHDHSCCSQRRDGKSCGRCLRGLLHRYCNMASVAWFEWYEKETGITLPLLADYKNRFPRRKHVQG
jgi:hypothetical protein